MESKDLKELSELYLKTVYEAKDESPEKEEEKEKEDDDLFGSPNKKNGKKKAKRWWDDDGDGKGYEKGEVKKEEYEVTAADKKGNTPAWQGYKAGKKNVKTGKPLYKAADHLKNEGYEETKKGEVLSAMKRQGRKLSDKDKNKIANKVVASKGDTSKSDDRYAYEEVSLEIKKLIESGKFSEEEIKSILWNEGYQRDPEGGEEKERQRRRSQKGGDRTEKVRGERTPMPPRGDKRREDFERWYAANVR